MLKIPLADIKSGMKLVKDVVLPDGRLLLLAGFIIKPVYLKKLESFNIDFVYIDESPYEHVEEFNEEKLHNEACKAIKTLMYSIREGDTVDMDIINNSVSDIVNAVMDNDAVMMQTTGIRDIDNYTFLYSVDVCIYAVTVGKKMGFKPEQLVSLGMGAILHDIGKCKVPLDILMKPGKLTDLEFQRMKLHTVYGCEIIKSTRSLNSSIANIAFQHHEKWDGSGYPLGIKSDKIDPFSRIVAVADVYDALTADRVYKKKMLPHLAARYIEKNANIIFDPYITDIFIANIGTYADGTMVLLNTGEVGIIIKSPADNNRKLKINVISSKNGPPVLRPYIVDLEANPGIEILEVYN